ncbi:MAG: PAS domain S-box protein, partial [Calditrichota bacterium]
METTPPRILIIEPDENVLEFLVEFLQFRGYLVNGAGDWGEAEGFISKHKYNLVVFAFDAPKEESALMAAHIAELVPEAPLVILTYPNRLTAATSAFNRPIFQFVLKPISDYEKFERVIRQALEYDHATADRKQLELRVDDYADRLAKLTQGYNQRLRELERQYRTLVENGQDAILILNGRGEVIDINQNACSLIGLSRQELIGSNICQSSPSDKLNNMFTDVLNELRFALECQFETEINRRDGSILPVKVMGLVIAAQRPPQRIVYIRNISEIREQRVRFQEKVRQLEEQVSQFENQGFNPGLWFKKIFQSASLVTAMLDKDGIILDWNPYAAKLTGFSRQDAFLTGFITQALPTHANEILEFCSDRTEEKETNLTLTEVETLTAKGPARTLDLNLTRLHTAPENEIILLIGMDSTTGRQLREVLENHVQQLKRAAVARTKELLLNQERLSHLFNGSLDPLFEADGSGFLTDVNPAWLKLVGYSSLREVKGRHWLSDFAFSEIERNRLLQRLNEQGQLRHETCEIVRSDGSKLSALLTVTRQPSFDQEQIFYEGSLRDVTTLKQLESKLVEYSQNLEDIVEQRSQALAQSEAKYRRLADNAPDIIYQIDALALR